MIIYKLTSPSGKAYIGLTTTTLEKRWKQHIQAWQRAQPPYRRACTKLFHAFDSYPYDLWTKEVILETDDPMEEMRLILEHNTLEDGYNIHKGGQTGWFGLKLSEEHKLRQSMSRKEWFKTKAGKEWLGELSKKWEGNRLGVGRRTPGFLGMKHSQESKEQISETQKGQMSGVLKKSWAEGKFAHRRKTTKEELDARGCTMKGKRQTGKQKKAVTEANQKTWLVTFPGGRTQTVTNLNKFCRENGLDQGNLSRGSYKGYKAHKTS